MRYRDSAAQCPPICSLMAYAYKHDVENTVEKTFSYVSELADEEYTLEVNLNGALEDLLALQKLMQEFAEKDDRETREEIRVSPEERIYSLKAQVFDAEDQILLATKAHEEYEEYYDDFDFFESREEDNKDEKH